MFLCANGEEFDKHMISSNLYSPSDHAPLSVNIIIKEKFIQDKRQTMVKNSIYEENFVNELNIRVGHINSVNIPDYKMLEKITQENSHLLLKCVNMTKHSKVWWNEKCNRDLSSYQISRLRSDWNKFKKSVKRAKRIFFNDKI